MADGFQRVIIPYRPREAFRSFHERCQRWASLVVHRRGGKTVASINDLERDALENKRSWPPPRYAYIAPYYNQAKRIAWNYAKYYSDPIPGREFNESELKVTYPNNAELRLFGADNPDALRGDYFDGVVCDEFGDWAPTVWPLVVRPMLSDYKGRATFIGTPKGRNAFYKLHTEAEADPDNWFAMRLRASESGIIPPDELADLKRGMSEDQYEQEFECSFDAAIRGAYYAKLLKDAERQGRVAFFAQDPILQIKAHFDIGGPGKKADAMAIWINQSTPSGPLVLDYIEGVGQVLGYYVNELRNRGWGNALCVLPHDAGQTHADNPTGMNFEAHMQAAGFKTKLVSNRGAGAVMQRIHTGRRIFPRIRFNAATTGPGRDALACYAEKWDEDRNVGLGPDHNWASHAADAFGEMCCDYEEPKLSHAPRKPIGRSATSL